MKKKFVFSVVLLATIFALTYRFSQKTPPAAETQKKAPQIITVQTAANSVEVTETLTYPAIVTGDQVVSITAGAAGTAVAVPFSLGDRVNIGSLLTRIDNVGNRADTNYRDFQSASLQTSKLSKDQAEENLSAAKQYYKDLKKAYDSNSTSVTKAQVNAADKQIDIAELQLESARVTLRSLIDNHLITSPISGFVTEKDISTGDAVSVGQKIATISATKKIKFQFFVDAENLNNVKAGTNIEVASNDGQKTTATVKNVSPVADPDTKRFLIEAYPAVTDTTNFASGTLVTASLQISKHPAASGNLLLPLSALTIGQNESHIFIVDNGQAKRVNVSVIAILGDNAEIKVDLAPDVEIITTGNKLVSDGEAVNMQQ